MNIHISFIREKIVVKKLLKVLTYQATKYWGYTVLIMWSSLNHCLPMLHNVMLQLIITGLPINTHNGLWKVISGNIQLIWFSISCMVAWLITHHSLGHSACGYACPPHSSNINPCGTVHMKTWFFNAIWTHNNAALLHDFERPLNFLYFCMCVHIGFVTFCNKFSFSVTFKWTNISCTILYDQSMLW